MLISLCFVAGHDQINGSYKLWWQRNCCENLLVKHLSYLPLWTVGSSGEPFVQCDSLKKLWGFMVIKRSHDSSLLSLPQLWVVGKVAGWSHMLSHPSKIILPSLVQLAKRNKMYLVFLSGPEIIYMRYTQTGYKAIKLTSDSLDWMSAVWIKWSVDSIKYHLSKSPGGVW